MTCFPFCPASRSCWGCGRRRRPTSGSAITRGNFWADATRITFYLLLPVSFFHAVLLIASGVPQALAGSVAVATVEGQADAGARPGRRPGAITSAVGTNGSAFAGLTASPPGYDRMLGIAMRVGRFLAIVPILAIAGSLAAEKHTPPSAGSFPTTGALWVGRLVD